MSTKPQEPDAPMPLQEATAVPVPVISGGVEEYQSSEEIQMAHRAAFVDTEKQKAEQARQKQLTQKQKLHKLLDKYINDHNSTKEVRKMAKSSERTNDYQMDLSADLVEILEKIKKEVR